MERISTAQHAADVLRETDNPAISYHDTGLVHCVAERCGIGHHGPDTSRRVIAAIDRSNRGELLKGYVMEGRLTRTFWLPEYAPKRVKDAAESYPCGGGGQVETGR